MTDRDRLIELLKAIGHKHCFSDIGSIADHLIENGVLVNKWISVTERLPNVELDKAKILGWDVYPCLVTIKDKEAIDGRYVRKAFFYDGERFLKTNCKDITSTVTHWMPLPKPPKEVE